MNRTNSKRTMIGLFGLLVAFSVLGSGCYLEIEGEPLTVYVADVEVSWKLQGTQAPTLCSVYGVDHWVVEARGPESRDSFIDCRTNYWSTEQDLFALAEGLYSIRVRAFDAHNRLRAERGMTLDLLDRGYVEKLTVDFMAPDFNR